MNESRLSRQMDFLFEINKLKGIIRKSPLLGLNRCENSAEHSWHVAMLAQVLLEYADEPVDAARVTRMLLIHDIVEIDAGDVMFYDQQARASASLDEEAAAMRIFGLLPDEQRDDFISLWREFEAKETPEAKFASALDRAIPVILNHRCEGLGWRTNNISFPLCLERNRVIENGSKKLWAFIEQLILESERLGYFAKAA